MSLIQRVRAAVVIGLVWSILWAATGVAFESWRVFFGSPHLAFPFQYWPRFALGGAMVFGTFGFIAGVAFAHVLAKRARGRALHDIALTHATRWGALAGFASIVVTPLLTRTVAWPLVIVTGAVFALVGAGSAAVTLSIARVPVARPTAPGRRSAPAT